MIKRLICAVAFLTRIPIPRKYVFGAEDVGKSTVFFPLVGGVLGTAQLAFLRALEFGGVRFDSTLKVVLAAILLLIINSLLTGALHFDGLADTADGFGGGRDKERILEIMRDSLIGSYGATALILLILLKIIALAALIQSAEMRNFLILAPLFGRWATVPLGKFMPYARKSGGLGNSVTDYVGWTELLGATAIAGGAIYFLTDWKSGLICWLAVCLMTVYVARLCLKKIGGVTGDTLGANTEICEALVLLTAVFLTR